MSDDPKPRWLILDKWTHHQVADVYADTKADAERQCQTLGYSLTSHRIQPVLTMPTTTTTRRGKR